MTLRYSQKSPYLELTYNIAPRGEYLASLSDNQWTAFCHLAHGLNLIQTAEAMGSDVKKVTEYRDRINEEGGFDSPRALVLGAIQNGAVQLVPAGEQLDTIMQRYNTLEPREKNVLSLIGKGYDDQAIVDSSGHHVQNVSEFYQPYARPLSKATVKTYREAVTGKLGTANFAQTMRVSAAIDRAIQDGYELELPKVSGPFAHTARLAEAAIGGVAANRR